MKKLIIILAAVLILTAAADAAVILYNNINADKPINKDNVTVYSAGESYLPSSEINENNLAYGKDVSADSNVKGYSAEFAADGDILSYWEGEGAYPQNISIDFGKSEKINEVVVRLNPADNWGVRKMKFSISYTDEDGSTATVVEEKEYTFDCNEGNSISAVFGTVTAKGIIITFTANTGANGGQAAEIEAYYTE